jgi:hypothetical protein
MLFIVCDAVPRVVPWNAAKAEGVREKRLALAKYLSAAHQPLTRCYAPQVKDQLCYSTTVHFQFLCHLRILAFEIYLDKTIVL